MIKYVELTAPEASAFRQAKILSIECNEGDQISEGETLFRVKSGSTEIDLPSTRDGRIVEIIATTQENITISTPLLLLETEVDESTATKPINEDNSSNVAESDSKEIKDTAKQKSDETISTAQTNADKIVPQEHSVTDTLVTKKVPKKHEQQSLDLTGAETEVFEEVILDQVVETEKVQTQLNSADNILATHPTNVAKERVSPPQLTPSEPTVSQTMSASSSIQILVPDIGADAAKVIDILVKVGDQIATEDPLVTLESDKASMDVPSTHDGVVKSISVTLDQDVSEGAVILELDAESTATELTEPVARPNSEQTHTTQETHTREETVAAPTATVAKQTSQTIDITIPDIGGDSAKVIEILVAVGQSVDVEDPLVTLESDKASMDVPSSDAGTVESIEVAIDDDVSEGTVVIKLKSDGVAPTASENRSSAPVNTAVVKEASPAVNAPAKEAEQTVPVTTSGKSHASPSTRRFARELGVDLSQISGSGRKGRVTEKDVKAYVKGAINQAPTTSTASASGSGIPPIPAQDFSKFGDIEIQPLNRIKRLTATNLHRSWVNVPHVTHNDESNISDLESFRKQLNTEYANQGKGIKLSPLAFIVKAVVNALQNYPQFNSSLEPGGENLILKKYFHIGIAVDTPNGLVVPVVRDADKKSVAEIGKEMNTLAAKARDKKLTMNDMSGACFTISSLGGIGGTGFTPIVNAPEVAILGVSRSKMSPVWNGSDFEPGMMLPLSLSYDHRVIDGAEAARFTRHIAAVLEDVRRLTV